jgi:hypothetical protein
MTKVIHVIKGTIFSRLQLIVDQINEYRMVFDQAGLDESPHRKEEK